MSGSRPSGSHPLPDTCLHLGSWAPTPLTRVGRRSQGTTGEDPAPCIWAKLEFLNPGGSTKDRIADHILTKAWRGGMIGPGSLVVEASSGSTSIAMAMVCAQLGLRFLAVMPAGVSNERSLIIQAYGGGVHKVTAGASMGDCIAEARRIAAEQDGFLPAQFENPANAEAHRFGTAREVLKQLPRQSVDAVVAGVGTGGTLVGLYHGMRDHGCRAQPVLARPIATGGSNLVAGCFDHAECCSTFSGRIPGVMDGMSRLFQPAELHGLATIEVPDDRCLEVTRDLIRLGFPVGPSSGLNHAAAEATWHRLRAEGVEDPTVVTVYCDRMERYFSTELFGAGSSPSLQEQAGPDGG